MDGRPKLEAKKRKMGSGISPALLCSYRELKIAYVLSLLLLNTNFLLIIECRDKEKHQDRIDYDAVDEG